MFEPLRKLLLDLASGGEATENLARELVSGWAKRATEQWVKLRQRIDEAVQSALRTLGIPPSWL